MLFETFCPRVPHTEFQGHHFGVIHIVVDVVVLVWILGEDVQLTGVHVAQIGIEVGGVETHPQSEAKIGAAHRVAHDGDISERRKVRVVSDRVAGARVLAESVRLVIGDALTAPKEMCNVRTLRAQVSLKGMERAVVNRGEASQRRQGGENVN